MKITQVMAGAARGGAETFFERLTLALHQAGLAQDVIIRRNPDRAQLLKSAGIIAQELRFGGPLDFASRWKLKSLLRQQYPDIVLSWMSRAATMTPKGPYIHCARLGGYYKLKYYQTCDHLIGNTQDIVDYLIGEGWPAERAHYLPNFVPDVKSPAVPRRRFDTSDDVPLFLALGRLHGNKAFDVLLEALAKVPSAFLWLAGAGPLEAQLKSQARELGLFERVRFLGWQTDSAGLIAASDVVVVPSRIEPLGNVVLEAWAQTRPIIAARASGPVSLIDNAENGLLFDIDQADQLADAMTNLLLDKTFAGGLAENGRSSFEANFTETKVVAKYLDFFEQIRVS